MIVETKTEKVKFKPCTLSITFESEDELKMWMKMFSHDLGIPALVYGGDVSQEAKLSETMCNVHEKLVDLMYL